MVNVLKSDFSLTLIMFFRGDIPNFRGQYRVWLVDKHWKRLESPVYQSVLVLGDK